MKRLPRMTVRLSSCRFRGRRRRGCETLPLASHYFQSHKKGSGVMALARRVMISGGSSLPFACPSRNGPARRLAFFSAAIACALAREICDIDGRLDSWPGSRLGIAETEPGEPRAFAFERPCMVPDHIASRIARVLRLAEVAGPVAVLEFLLGDCMQKLCADRGRAGSGDIPNPNRAGAIYLHALVRGACSASLSRRAAPSTVAAEPSSSLVSAERIVSRGTPNCNAIETVTAASRAMASIGEPGLCDDKKTSAMRPSG